MTVAATQPRKRVARDREAERVARIFKAQLARAQNIDIKHLMCRLARHAWEQIPSDRTPAFGRLLTFQCLRCTSTRYDIVDPRYGSLLSRSYDYVPEYKLKAPADGTRAMSIEALRVELVRRGDRAVEAPAES